MNFRIWDKALQRWVEERASGTHCFTETYISLSGEVVEFLAGFPEKNEEPSYNKDRDAFFRDGKFWTATERYVVQRGTDLRDINGKEIFEGDIVKADESIAKVSYFDGAFWAEEESENTLLLVHSWEVIGNIFENQSLIK